MIGTLSIKKVMFGAAMTALFALPLFAAAEGQNPKPYTAADEQHDEDRINGHAVSAQNKLAGAAQEADNNNNANNAAVLRTFERQIAGAQNTLNACLNKAKDIANAVGGSVAKAIAAEKKCLQSFKKTLAGLMVKGEDLFPLGVSGAFSDSNQAADDKINGLNNPAKDLYSNATAQSATFANRIKSGRLSRLSRAEQTAYYNAIHSFQNLSQNVQDKFFESVCAGTGKAAAGAAAGGSGGVTYSGNHAREGCGANQDCPRESPYCEAHTGTCWQHRSDEASNGGAGAGGAAGGGQTNSGGSAAKTGQSGLR